MSHSPLLLSHNDISVLNTTNINASIDIFIFIKMRVRMLWYDSVLIPDRNYLNFFENYAIPLKAIV